MATLQQITTKAKVLYKTGKYKKWTDAIKAASKLVKKKPVKKAAKKKPQRVGQWVKGTTRMYEFKKEKPLKKYPKNVEVKRSRSGTFSKFKSKISGLFDTAIIKDLDQLKKEYYKLAKIYHPDAGGTKEQFQKLEAEYKSHIKTLLNGSNLSNEDKANELQLDENLRTVINALIGLPKIQIDILHKWIWVSGDTYPIKNELKAAGLFWSKNRQKWYYAGVKSSGGSDKSFEELGVKYGKKTMYSNDIKKISGISIPLAKRTKIKNALKRIVKALQKRPI